MAHLISDLKKLNNEIKGDVFEKFLAPNLFLDSPIMVIPYILECCYNKYILFREQESGNIDLIDFSNFSKVRYNPYFLPGKDKKLVAKNIFQAIKEILNKENENGLQIDYNLPYAFYKDLSLNLKKANILKPKINYIKKTNILYSVNTEDIINRLKMYRQKAQPFARDLILTSTDRSVLEQGISKIEDSRFPLLNNIMKDNDFSAVLMSSNLNVQELIGLSLRNNEFSKVSVLYRLEDEKVFILSEFEINEPGIRKIDIFTDYFQALESICSKNNKIGFEDHLVSISEYDKFIERNFLLREGTLACRKWREYRAGEDLVFYIIAGKASSYAMEKVLKEASSQINQNKYDLERVLFKKYLDYFNKFKVEYNLPYKFIEYFTGFYVPDRTLYPSIPSKFRISENSNEVKLDAGILMVDSTGFILGTTDIARTLALSLSSSQIYEAIKDTIKNSIIPNIKNANTFEDIFIQGAKAFSEKSENMLKKYNLCPSDFYIEKNYSRDIGHLMGKQESFDEKIIKGNKNKIRNNLIGCVEIQWQYKKHALVYEDMWYKRGEGIANITG